MSDQVYGAVNRDGSIHIEGSKDWTSKKVKEGVYEIVFAVPFSSQPVVIASGYIPREQGGAASDNTFCVGPIKNESVLIRSFDVVSKDISNAGKEQDSPFTFIAIGLHT